jgi:hypothetical protein
MAVEPIEFLEEPDSSLFDFVWPWPLSKAMVSLEGALSFSTQNRLVDFALPKAMGEA